MGATTNTGLGSGNGRVRGRLVDELRRRILTGKVVPGGYLPTVRELSATHGLARKTVNGALKKLEGEGLVVAEPRCGYRVLARAADPDLGCPMAYLPALDTDPDNWNPLHQELLAAFQQAASEQGWALMGLGVQGRDTKSVMKQITAARVCGLILDSVDPAIVHAARHAGLPTVAVDCAEANLPMDTIVQDSYTGGMLAAEHLVDGGHERIAWLGPVAWSPHSLARVSGTAAGMMKHGRFLAQRDVIECPRDDSESYARRLLEKKDRPTGVVALYRQVATVLVRVAREMGFQIGRDLDVVAWTTEQEYERDWLPLFQDRPAAAIVWSPRRMAEMAVERVDVLRKNPGLSPVRVNVPVELRT